MICEVYQSHPWRHGNPPDFRRISAIRIAGSGGSSGWFDQPDFVGVKTRLDLKLQANAGERRRVEVGSVLYNRYSSVLQIVPSNFLKNLLFHLQAPLNWYLLHLIVYTPLNFTYLPVKFILINNQSLFEIENFKLKKKQYYSIRSIYFFLNASRFNCRLNLVLIH